MFYAGIGSRKTPENVLTIMRGLGFYLAQHGLTLRSGRAVGADAAFEFGCVIAGGLKELFTHHQTGQAWLAHAEKYHPAWNKCDDYAKRLHGRNSAIMLGFHLNNPVKFVVCWTQDGLDSGGVGQALRIARAYNIPVFNLFNVHSDQIWQFIKSGACHNG